MNLYTGPADDEAGSGDTGSGQREGEEGDELEGMESLGEFVQSCQTEFLWNKISQPNMADVGPDDFVFKPGRLDCTILNNRLTYRFNLDIYGSIMGREWRSKM